MAVFIKHQIDRVNFPIFNFSDLHDGSKAFHEVAFKRALNQVVKDNGLITIGGDLIEGKEIDSPHFNPDGLKANKLNIHKQADSIVELLKPVADRLLMIQFGNHELYLLKNFDIIKYICDKLGRPDIYGHYQTWLQVNNVTMFFWHGRPTMPRGAKDPIQREANQKAWLKNKLQSLAGSAQAMYMGHTHQCQIVPPIEQYALLNHGDNVHGRYFTEEVRELNGDVWVPPDARWYVNTGTFRRGGGFDQMDYSEIAGYNPPPIACTKTYIRKDKIVKIEKLLF